MKQKRLRILGDDEIEAIYHRPRFTHEERLEYFSLSPKELTAMEQLHSITSRIYFILQLGYFKARQLFFVFSLKDVSEDVKYIIEQYFPNFQFTDFEITKVTRLKHQRLIQQLCNYRSCDAAERQKLETKALQAAMVCSKPIYVCREMMHYLQEERIVAPGYSFLQKMVGKALTSEQNRLICIVRHHLKPSSAWKPFRKQMTVSAMTLQSYLSFSIIISGTLYIPVVTDRNLKHKFTPSMLDSRRNTSDSKRGLFPTPW